MVRFNNTLKSYSIFINMIQSRLTSLTESTGLFRKCTYELLTDGRKFQYRICHNASTRRWKRPWPLAETDVKKRNVTNKPQMCIDWKTH